MPSEVSNLETARRYLKAIEEGDLEYVVALFTPEAVVKQLPNRIYPNGSSAGVARIAAAFEKGRKLFSRQTYAITSEAANGDIVVLEVLWTGQLAIPFGSIAAGGEMRAHSAMFMEFRDGKIVAQRNYDCFDPW